MNAPRHPHRRQNLLTGDWVLVSPQRMNRPWQGEVGAARKASGPDYDPDCYLCPGNVRTGGQANPQFSDVFVFPNDFPALLDESEEAQPQGLFREMAARGEARVITYSPNHSATLASLEHAERRAVVDSWCDLSRELGQRWAYVQIFENKGAMMGASSPHPHGQVWASDFIPTLVERENKRQARHMSEHGNNLLGDVAEAEVSNGTRFLAANAHWLCIVPHWAAWPFETLLIARENISRLEDVSSHGKAALAEILGQILPAYDAIFDTSFPYSMGWHGAPHALGDKADHWRLHAHFYPPLLRSAEIRKHMVGYELMAETQRDLTPEAAAERIRQAMS